MVNHKGEINLDTSSNSVREKTWMGVRRIIFAALIAIFIFMTGDGIKQAFLSKKHC